MGQVRSPLSIWIYDAKMPARKTKPVSVPTNVACECLILTFTSIGKYKEAWWSSTQDHNAYDSSITSRENQLKKYSLAIYISIISIIFLIDM